MQFAGSQSEQLSFFWIDSANQLIEQRTSHDARALQIAFAGEHALVVPTDGIECKCPGVALVRRGALQQANHRRFAFEPPKFDRPAKRGNMWKITSLRQETRHFHIWVYSVFELSVEFEEETFLEQHRRIALLDI